MQKTIITAALMGLALPAAAEVKLYGQIKASLSSSQVSIKGSAGEAKRPTLTRLYDHRSRMGISGKEKLGDDLTAIWQIEQETSFAGDGTWATRDSFIGLEGNFGKIRAGNMNNQLNEMDTIDLWMYRNSAAGLGLYTRTGSRRVSLRYDTPEFSGFSANVQIVPRDNENPEDSGIHNEPTRAQYNLGLNYQNDAFFAKLGYNLKKNRYLDSAGNAKDGHVVRLESGYTGDKLFLGFGLQHARGVETGNEYISYFTHGFNIYNGAPINQDPNKTEGLKVTDAAVTASYNLGRWVPRIGYAHGWAAKGINSGNLVVDKFDQIIVGTDYILSKQARVRGQVGHMRVGGKTRLNGNATGKIQQTVGQVGLHYIF